MSDNVNKKWKSFIAWLDTPPLLRGSVATEEDWAAANGTTARTLRRWKQDPAFLAYRASLGANAPAVDAPTVGGSDEDAYDAIKAKLVEGARSGNPKALELYFKTYGKPFVEEEAASRSMDLASADLPELVAAAVASLAPEELERALRDLGWTVERPEGA